MRLISSKGTFFSKRVFPAVWFGGLAFAFIRNLCAGNKFRIGGVIIPVIMGVFGYFVMKRLVFGLVDEVWDDGDELVARNNGMESRIPLANIINVSSSNSYPSRITLTLREPCAFGKEVGFSPPRRFFAISTHPIAAELIGRIDEKRRAG